MKRKQVKLIPPESRRILQLKIELLDVSPTVWRRVQVPAWFNLEHLHEVIQRSFGWMDRHEYRYTIDGVPYVRFRGRWREDAGEEDARVARLAQVISKDWMLYEYDLGDGWKHKLSFEDFLEVDSSCMYPVCIDGANACPPEDCGGPVGYADLLTKLSNPNDPEHEEARSWVGGHFDPKGFDPNIINRCFLWPEESFPSSDEA